MGFMLFTTIANGKTVFKKLDTGESIFLKQKKLLVEGLEYFYPSCLLVTPCSDCILSYFMLAPRNCTTIFVL